MNSKTTLLIALATWISADASAQVPVRQIDKTIQANRTVKLLPAAPDVSNIRMCVDRYPAVGQLPQRDYTAITAPVKINPDGSLPNVGVVRQPLAGETMKMWNPGQTISVYLNTNNGSDFIRQKVMTFARKWETVANIKFNFINSFNDAQIKVEFSNDNRSWSWIGRDVLFNPLRLYTMHYGWFENSTTDIEFSRTVVHEFGHALGFIHEHQSPAAGIQWDREKVYTYMAGPPNNWSRAEVDANLFAKYSASSTNSSRYDPLSIMHYSIPAGLTLNGFEVGDNTALSATDISFARQVYPFPPAISNNSGTLRTGDDCDEVDFLVEYNAVAPDKVEFTFELGKKGNKNVTWWKQITIPLTGNRKSELWIQNHSLIASENRTWTSALINKSELDNSNGIAFWKAKLLGVHTLLPYRWNVLSALPGGCRVRLVWKNDSCL